MGNEALRRLKTQEGILDVKNGRSRKGTLFFLKAYAMFSVKEERALKIEISVEPQAEDTMIKITCKELTPELEKLMATLRMLDKKLTASRQGEIYLLDIADIIYIETLERKTFVYTGNEVYESTLRLYELEQQLCDCGFFRAGKSCLVQLKFIKSLKLDLNRRIRLTLENGEQLMVSRQYTEELKKRLGVK